MSPDKFSKLKRKVLPGPQIVVNWVINLFSFQSAVINELYSDQSLLFEGTTCKIAWRTKGTYCVKIFLNKAFYLSYAPNGVALLPVEGSFGVELIALSIYGSTRQALSLPVKHVCFKETDRFLLNPNAESRPVLNQSLLILLTAKQPVNPVPVLKFLPISLDSLLLIASRENLEKEISNSYQTETYYP